MKRMGALVACLMALQLVGASAALAAELNIPIDTVVYAEPGSVTELAREDTPPALIGASCVSVAQAENQSSVHPGNDLIIESDGSSTVLEDVERAPGAVTEAAGAITLGADVTVSLRMGEDGVFSAGLVVIIADDCVPPTTTTTSSTTTTTSSTTTSTTSTTTTEPPGGSTTTTEPTTSTTLPGPAILIVKDATPAEMSDDGVGSFTITVTNIGNVPLTNVRVTDDVAVAIDPGTDCANSDLPDLDPLESTTYECTVSGLATDAPWTNEATSIGTPPTGPDVTSTDTAQVVPPPLGTTITQPPTTTQAPTTTGTPTETLPNTGPGDEVRGFAMVGMAFLLAGLVVLGGAALIGRLREER